MLTGMLQCGKERKGGQRVYNSLSALTDRSRGGSCLG
jgi:hypothetical protein